MRENIGLYRGKRIDNGKWVEGNAMIPRLGGETCIVVQDAPYHSFVYEVTPETVGECSGVPDKNGIMMYEGDIVTGRFRFGMAVNSVVVFRDGSFGLQYELGEAPRFTAFTSMCNIEYEIIGNIHDNPELILGGYEE